MVRILGLVDIFAAVILIFIAVNHEAPIISAIIISIILLLKSIEGLFDIASIIDVFAAIVMFLGIFLSMPFIVLLIAGILVGQKGLVSVFNY